MLYNPALDQSFFVDEFIEGLKLELRSAIRLHLPEDLDTASLLALLQEEELESMPKHSRNDSKDYSKFSARSDRSHKEHRSTQKSNEVKKSDTGKWEEKLDSLRA